MFLACPCGGPYITYLIRSRHWPLVPTSVPWLPCLLGAIIKPRSMSLIDIPAYLACLLEDSGAWRRIHKSFNSRCYDVCRCQIAGKTCLELAGEVLLAGNVDELTGACKQLHKQLDSSSPKVGGRRQVSNSCTVTPQARKVNAHQHHVFVICTG